jgi:hypothetical protein
MNVRILIGLMICTASLSAQDTQTPKPRPRLALSQQSWLGMEVTKPTPEIAAQLPLANGIGFVVRKVHEQGPAQSAGVREHDVLEKLGDQKLVNEAQLVTLLRLLKPGEQAVFSGYRAGTPIEHRIRIEQINSQSLGKPIISPDLHRRTASVSNADGSAEVSRVPSGYRVVIRNPQKEVVFEQTLPESGFGQVPAPWRVRVMALRRGLDHQLQPAPRQPRPRIVTPPKPAPAEDAPASLSASGNSAR